MFESIYGKDKLEYKFLQGKGTQVQESCDPRLLYEYDHQTWEANYEGFLESLYLSKSVTKAKSLSPQLDLCSSQSPQEQSCPVTLESQNAASSCDVQMPAVTINTQASSASSSATSSVAACLPTTSSSSTVIDLTESTHEISSCGSEAWLKMISSLSRKELSNITVPQVSVTASHSSNVTSLFGAYNEKDPLLLHERPCESLVDEAEKALGRKRGHKYPTGVKISNTGSFSRNGVTILKKFCEISALQSFVHSEDRWLDEMNPDDLSMSEILAIKEVLWNRRVTETVLRAGQKSLDVGSFSTLVAERYLDNFVIDVTISWFLQNFKDSRALYLPTETHTWLSTNDNQFIQRKLHEVLSMSRDSEFDLVLCPLHMSQSHWGIIAIDLIGEKLLFDDGLKWQPDASVLPSIKFVLDFFHYLRPNARCFSSSFWASVDKFERFGMPSQRDCDVSGQGSGSCGVGVILAARDFIIKGVPEQ